MVNDKLGVPLEEGDVVIHKDILFRIVNISVNRLVPPNPTLAKPSDVPPIVHVRMVADITTDSFLGTNIETFVKAAFVPKTPLKKNQKPPEPS